MLDATQPPDIEQSPVRADREGLIAAALSAVVAAVVSLPLLLQPNRLLHADTYRAYDWLEVAKWRWYARDALLTEGHLPRWNPFLEGGLPAYAHPSDGTLSPMMGISVLFGVLQGLKIEAFLMALVGAAGTALLARRWLRVSPAAAAVAGVVFAVSGYLPSRVAVGFYESTLMCVVPVAMLGMFEASRRGAVAGLPWVVGAGALLAATGVQMQLCLAFSFLQMGLLALLAPAAGDRLRRVLPVLVAVAAVTAALGAYKFVPMIDFVAERGYRILAPPKSPGLLAGISGPLRGLFETAEPMGVLPLAPGVVTLPVGQLGEYDFTGLPLVVLPLLLAGLALAPRRAAAPSALFVVTLLLGWSHLHRPQLSLFELLRHLPLLSSMRNTARYVSFFLLLWGAIGAGVGVAALRSRFPRHRRLVLVAVGLLLLPQAARSATLFGTVFKWQPPVPHPAAALHHVQMPPRPSAATSAVRAFNWVGPQMGLGALYRAEDLPHLPSAVKPALALSMDGEWSHVPDHPGEVWLLSGAGTASGLRLGPDRLRFRADVQPTSVVIVNQNPHPGWRGPPGTVVYQHDALLAVRFDRPFRGEVELHFAPPLAVVGMRISGGTAGLLAALLLLARRRRHRQRVVPQ